MARPRIELTEDQIRIIKELAGIGVTVKRIAKIIGVSERTLERRTSENEAVLAALEDGREEAAEKVGKALFVKACDGDVGAIRWYEMTRCGRSAKTESEVNVTFEGEGITSLKNRDKSS